MSITDVSRQLGGEIAISGVIPKMVMGVTNSLIVLVRRPSKIEPCESVAAAIVKPENFTLDHLLPGAARTANNEKQKESFA